jgi:hypothetical protein
MLGMVVATSTILEILLACSIAFDITFDGVGSESNPLVHTCVDVALYYVVVIYVDIH